MNQKEIIELFKEKGIRSSHQRLLIFEYLSNNYNHPTVDAIYESLKPSMASLSKTTVYNTLKSLMQEGLVRAVTIENNELRYDATTNTHGHFKCDVCKEIYDFEVSAKDVTIPSLQGFTTTKTDIFLNGICPKCQNK